MVGNRLLDHRLEHLGGAVHRHERGGIRPRACHLGVRMGRCGHAHPRGAVPDPGVPEKPHLYDAAVFEAAVRAARSDHHGGVLVAGVRVYQPHEHPLSRGPDGGKPLGIPVHGLRRFPRRVRDRHHDGRHEGHRLHRRDPGGGPGAGRIGHDAAGARPGGAALRPDRGAGRVSPIAGAGARAFSHDSRQVESPLQRTARPGSSARRDVGRQHQLLGVQPVHHPAGLGRRPQDGAGRHPVRRCAEGADAIDRGSARDRCVRAPPKRLLPGRNARCRR